MAISLLILLPVAASLFWFLIHLLMAQRNSTFGIFLVLLAAAVGTFFTYACYDSPTVSWQLFGFSCLLSMFVSPCLIPLTWMYLRRMNPSDTYQNPMQLIWIIAPVALFTGAFLTYMIAGPEKMQIFLEYLYTEGHRKAHELYYGSVEWHFHRWVSIVYRAVIAIETISLLAMCITMSRKNDFRTKKLKGFLKGDRIKLRQLQMHVVMLTITFIVIKICLPRTFLVAHTWISCVFGILFALCVSLFSYFALFGDKHYITIKEIQLGWMYNYSSKNKEAAVEYLMTSLMDDAEKETLKRVGRKLVQKGINMEDLEKEEEAKETESDGMVHTINHSREENSLMTRFERLMIGEKLYLQPSLTLQDVAARLQSNKTYISKLVNSTYNQGFPDLVNSLRIEYAQQYILNNRSAKQEDIAKACGFLSASTFKNIFKKITGTTPRGWLAAQKYR